MLGVNMRQRLSLLYLSGKKLVKIPKLLGRQTYTCSGVRATAAGQGVGKLSGIHITAFVSIVSVVTFVADIRRLFDPAAMLWLVGWAEFSAFDDSALDTRYAALHICANVMLVTGSRKSAITAEIKGCGDNCTVCFDLSGNGGRVSADSRRNLFEGFAGSDSGFNGNSVR